MECLQYFDVIKYPANKRSLGFNGYRFYDDYMELHIKTNKDGFFIVILDKNVFEIMYKEYWCISFVGREECKSPAVNCYINRAKYRLKDIIYPELTGFTTEHLNNNGLDFRRENLRVLGKHSKKVDSRASKKYGLPRGITVKMSRIDNTRIQGYCVREGSEDGKYFSVSKCGSPEKALSEAMKYYEYIVKGE